MNEAAEAEIREQAPIAGRLEIAAICRRVYGRYLPRLMMVNIAACAAAVCEVLTLSLILLVAQALVKGEAPVAAFGLLPSTLLTAWSIPHLLAACVALILVRLAARFGEALYSAKISAEYECEQRLRLVTSLLHADWRKQDAEPTGRIQVLLTKNVQAATRLLFSLGTLTFAIVNLAVLLAAALLVDWVCAAIIAAVAVAVFLALRPLSTSVQRCNQSQLATYTRFANELGQGIAMSRELRTFGVVREFCDRLRREVGRYRDFRIAQLFLGQVIGPLYQNAALLMLVGGLAAIYFTGFQRVDSLGLVMVLFVRSLTYGQQVQIAAHAVHDGVPYLKELLDVEQSYADYVVSDIGRPLPTIESLGMRDATFAYDARRPILNRISFEVSRGELIGIVGPSGCGKSTLLQLLLRLYEPQTGEILVNGQPHSEFSQADWQTRFAFVPQESLMFDESIVDCIRFFRGDLTEADVYRAARQANLHDDVLQFVDGFATRVGERGGKLSGGQRQRLSIARALAGRPDVLILDEPTGALDQESEAAVLRSLVELKGEVTTFIVSHRPSTLDVCDRVMVLREGRIQAFDHPSRLAGLEASRDRLSTIADDI